MNKGFILGFIIAVIFILINYNRTGEPPNMQPTMYPIYKGMLMPSIGKNKVLHIHHWILSLPMIAFGSPIVQGTAVALCMHGLNYPDRFEIIQNSPW